MAFSDFFSEYSWQQLAELVYASKEEDVLQVMRKSGKRSLKDFAVMVSPAADDYLEQMAAKSRMITQQRFGKIIQMYLPIYLSNLCCNSCTYCGFSQANRIDRIVLDQEQILREVQVVKSYGFDHVLLVTGESGRKAGVDYLENVLKLIRPYFSQIALEVQPLAEQEYRRLIEQGLNTVCIYQETYHSANYSDYHPSGPKADFEFRLNTADRLGRAGVHRIGLGVLLGLEDWRVDACCLALHLLYLEKKYWRTKYSVSFPRLRPAQGVDQAKTPVSEKDLLQLICAFRIFNPDLELSLSTRERPLFRDNLISLGVTSISAGSKTEPGGYARGVEELEQFVVNDNRSALEVAQAINKLGYLAVWKDWDGVLG